IILKTYDWAIEQREKGVCIVSGFHSKIEKDVFDILIKGTQPIILVLARGLMNRWSHSIKDGLNSERLLIISPFSQSIKRVSRLTALKRNKLIADLSDEIVIAYKRNEGVIHDFIKTLPPSKKISYL
ncbi:MAG: DNA-binding protein, partial [Ignavibacteria bacterium]|nr:DNA-binding protein [Ignavibacteria bacterium]